MGTAALYRVLDWFEVDLGFTRAFIYSNRFLCSVCLVSGMDNVRNLVGKSHVAQI